MSDDTLKELNWGETPFDGLSEDELKTHCYRMYSALNSASSVISMRKAISECRGENSESGYFGPEGSGGQALEKCEQAIGKVEGGIDDETIYRSYFRYVDDLLFDATKYEIGASWSVCDGCGTMVSDKPDRYVGKSCHDKGLLGDKGCTGTFRKLEWPDMATLPTEEGTE